MQHNYRDNNYPKAILYSTLVMGLFLLLGHLVILHQPFKQEDIGTGGIIVNYGTTDMGMGNDYMSVEEPSTHDNANHLLPDKAIADAPPIANPSAETSDKNIVTQNTEEAPTLIKKHNVAPPTATINKDLKDAKKPTINPNALYKGAKKEGSSEGDGTGNIAGNQGTKNGDPLSGNYGEGGSGSGNVNLSLVNRRFVSTPKIDDQGQSAGKVVVEIRVDKTGEVVFARAGAKGTTLSDLKLWKKCEDAVLGARLNKLDSAPEIQFGVVTFNFSVR